MRVLTDRFHIGQGTQIGPITAFPVWTEAKLSISYDTTPVATLQVSELESPTIENLNIASTHPLPVLLPEGTVLDGGMQTRVLSRDVLIPTNRAVQVSTLCVESGRWSGGKRHEVNGRAPLSVISALRGLRQDARGVRRDGSEHRQQVVWDSVARYETNYGRRATSSLSKLMRDEEVLERNSEQERINRRFKMLTEQLARFASNPLPGQSGVILGVGGHPVMLEIMTSNRNFKKHFETLLNAIALDAAVAEEIPTTSSRARKFAEIVMDTPLEILSADITGQLMSGSNELVDIKALQPTLRGGAAIHTTVINRSHELILA
jgi:hypothetical protein